MASNLIYLDTETTGINASVHRIVEIAIVDNTGKVLINTLVNPGRSIPRDASAIHGINDDMVSGSPTLDKLWPTIRSLIAESHVVIYNAAFDRQFFPDQLRGASRVSCAMLAFAKAFGERDRYRQEYRWQKLDIAAKHVGHRWTGEAHRALADALACRSVWRWLAH